MNMKTTMMTLVAMMVTLCAMMPNAAVAQYQVRRRILNENEFFPFLLDRFHFVFRMCVDIL